MGGGWVRPALVGLSVAALSFGIAVALRGNKPVDVKAPVATLAPEPRGENVVDWTWSYRMTPKQVVDLVGTTERIVAVEVERASPLLLDVATVHNAGRDAHPWWWLPGTDPEATGGDLGGYASRHSARITCLAPYVVGGETRFAAVFMENTQEGAAWWWYYDQSRQGIDDVLAKNDARPIDVRSYRKGAETLYSVVMIPRRGERSWWYAASTKEVVKTRLKENGATLVSLHAAEPGGLTFDAIMNASAMGTMPEFLGVSWAWGTEDIE